MKKIFPSVFAFIATTFASQAQILNFSDISTWVGSGSSQSAIVIQWRDAQSPPAVAWGYRWDGALTVNDMLLGVMAANVGLFARGDSSTGFGAGYFGFGYDQNQDAAFGVSGAVDTLGASTSPVFTNGFADMNTNPATTQAPATSLTAAPSNSADRYQEGWNDNGFWELFVGTTGSAYPASWTSSFIGAGESLVDNGWFAFTLSNSDFSSNVPGPAFAAIPEPGSIWLFIAAGGVLFVFYARKRIYSH